MTALILFAVWLIGGSVIAYACFYASRDQLGEHPRNDGADGDWPLVPTIHNSGGSHHVE